MAKSTEIKKEETKTVQTETASSNETQRIKALEDTIKSLQESLTEMANIVKASQEVQIAPVVAKGNTNEVTLVSNTNCAVECPFATWTLMSTRIGQKITIQKSQFNELVNTKRSYFDCEYFLLDSRHMDIAEDLNLPVYLEGESGYLCLKDLSKIKNMDVEELQDYYKGLTEASRRNFVDYFMSKCNDKEAGFYNVDKMQAMNTLTKGHLFDMLIALCVSDNAQ